MYLLSFSLQMILTLYRINNFPWLTQQPNIISHSFIMLLLSYVETLSCPCSASLSWYILAILLGIVICLCLIKPTRMRREGNKEAADVMITPSWYFFRFSRSRECAGCLTLSFRAGIDRIKNEKIYKYALIFDPFCALFNFQDEKYSNNFYSFTIPFARIDISSFFCISSFRWMNEEINPIKYLWMFLTLLLCDWIWYLSIFPPIATVTAWMIPNEH